MKKSLPFAKLPKPISGYRRQWYKCKEKDCGRVFYKDYVPFSLSTPVQWTPCGHSIGARDYNMEKITVREARSAYAQQRR